MTASHRIDLDAARAERDAARAEVSGEPHEVVFRGRSFELPAELPYSVAEAMAEGEPRGALVCLIGEERATEFFDLGPSNEDMEALARGIVALYRTDQGESAASSPSSPNGSGRSRPITSVRTA